MPNQDDPNNKKRAKPTEAASPYATYGYDPVTGQPAVNPGTAGAASLTTNPYAGATTGTPTTTGGVGGTVGMPSGNLSRFTGPLAAGDTMIRQPAGATTTTTAPSGGTAVGGGGGGGPLSGLPLVGGAMGNILQGSGLSTTPATWDSAKASASPYEVGQTIYKQGMSNAAALATGPQIAPITAMDIAAPSTITSQTIGEGSIIAGQDADALRARQLSQAEGAAMLPSSAEAQMKAASGLVSRQMLGQAAAARGGARGVSARDAMLATGTRGMEAAQTTAALKAQEDMAKQNALTSALGNVRAGDVSVTGARTAIGTANQGAALDAAKASATNQLAADKATQDARLRAAESTGQLGINAFNAKATAQNAALGTALQGGGLQNQTNSTVAGYQANYDQDLAKQKAAAAQTGAGLLNTLGSLSDDRAKDNVSPLMGPYGSYNQPPASGSPYANFLTAPKVEVIPWGDEGDKGKSGGLGLGTLAAGGGLLALSDASTKEFVDKLMLDAESPSARRKSATETAAKSGNRGDKIVAKQAEDQELAYAQNNTAWTDNPGFGLSDELTKEQIDKMSTDEIIDWAEKVPAVSFKYKDWVPSMSIGSNKTHDVGTTAQALEASGPIGKMLVDQGPDGFKRVNYGALGFMTAKAALAKAGKKGK